MSNDPAAIMARLAALCADLCETESATIDRRQLCDWLAAIADALARATAAEAAEDELRDAATALADLAERNTDDGDEWRDAIAAVRAALGGEP